jgi:hypothetical protein
LLIEIFLISNYSFPSFIDTYEGADLLEGDKANLWEIIGQSVGLLEVKLSNKNDA